MKKNFNLFETWRKTFEGGDRMLPPKMTTRTAVRVRYKTIRFHTHTPCRYCHNPREHVRRMRDGAIHYNNRVNFSCRCVSFTTISQARLFSTVLPIVTAALVFRVFRENVHLSHV